MRHPNDYRLERWLAALFSLLFLLPAVADAQTIPVGDMHPPACHGDVGPGGRFLEPQSDAEIDAPLTRFGSSIRATVPERSSSC